VVAISPVSFPLNLVAHKVGPAIAVGAPVVLKPLLLAPTVALELARLAVPAGLPPAHLIVVTCADDVAARLATHSSVSLIS